MASANRYLAGLVLAGGQGRRLGGIDKGLAEWMGRPLVEWAIDALKDQVDGILISANRNREIYARYGYPVLNDRLSGFQGPLAGIASALREIDCDWLLCVPCDSPCIPRDLARRLAEGLKAECAEIAVASDGVRVQPLHALIPAALAPSLDAYLARGERSVLGWYGGHRVAQVEISEGSAAFANLNTQEDRARLSAAWAARRGAPSAMSTPIGTSDGATDSGPTRSVAPLTDDLEMG